MTFWSRARMWSSDNVMMCRHVTNQICNLSSLARAMAMKLGKPMTYGELNAPIKSHVLLTTWLHKFTWQTKNRIFLPLENLWPPNFAGTDIWWGEVNNEVARIWSRDRKKSRTCQIENLIYFLLQGLYHHTWKGCDAWLFDHAALWRHMENLKLKFKFVCKN